MLNSTWPKETEDKSGTAFLFNSSSKEISGDYSVILVGSVLD